MHQKLRSGKSAIRIVAEFHFGQKVKLSTTPFFFTRLEQDFVTGQFFLLLPSPKPPGLLHNDLHTSIDKVKFLLLLSLCLQHISGSSTRRLLNFFFPDLTQTSAFLRIGFERVGGTDRVQEPKVHFQTNSALIYGGPYHFARNRYREWEIEFYYENVRSCFLNDIIGNNLCSMDKLAGIFFHFHFLHETSSRALYSN